MLFLTDVDHVSFEKANETRQNNLQSATVSLQVVIGLCRRKETAALKIKAVPIRQVYIQHDQVIVLLGQKITGC